MSLSISFHNYKIVFKVRISSPLQTLIVDGSNRKETRPRRPRIQFENFSCETFLCKMSLCPFKRVDKNIIGAPKMRNNSGAIKLFYFPILLQQQWPFSLLLLVQLSLLIFFAFFGISIQLFSVQFYIQGQIIWKSNNVMGSNRKKVQYCYIAISKNYNFDS